MIATRFGSKLRVSIFGSTSTFRSTASKSCLLRAQPKWGSKRTKQSTFWVNNFSCLQFRSGLCFKRSKIDFICSINLKSCQFIRQHKSATLLHRMLYQHMPLPKVNFESEIPLFNSLEAEMSDKKAQRRRQLIQKAMWLFWSSQENMGNLKIRSRCKEVKTVAEFRLKPNKKMPARSITSS